MNEQLAKSVVLVRAIESTDTEREVLTEDDRMYASRSANELAQWDAADKKAAPTPELFLQKRAEQIQKKISERYPVLSVVVSNKNSWYTISIVVPLLALFSGIFLDRITDPHRVDLLSAPLLMIIGWNFLVYVLSVLLALFPALRTRWSETNFLHRWMAAAIFSSSTVSARFLQKKGRKLPAPLVLALTNFSTQWLTLSTPLTAARVKRIVHFSAACFVTGVIISLYIRGILSAYQAGWESTFLEAGQVHAILSVLFTPAIFLFHLPGFSMEQIVALQLPQAVMPVNGALWVHLYAGSLFVFVIVPRMILTAFALRQERKFTRDFPLDLEQPYFRKLTSHIGPAAEAVMRVFPYSFAVDELRDKNLHVLAKTLLGDQARLMLRPSTQYGEEIREASQRADSSGAVPAQAEVALTVLLFNLSATPEKENHGAFLAHFRKHSQHVILVLLDESSYLARFAGQAGGEVKVMERIALWRQFCELHHVSLALVNLLDPQAHADELERCFSRASALFSLAQSVHE
jgi:hypothetical protein